MRIVYLYGVATFPTNAIRGEEQAMMEGQQDICDFFEWLSSHVTTTHYRQLRSVYSYLEEFCINKKLMKCSLMDCDDIATVRKARTALVSNKVYRFNNRGKTDDMALLLQCYENYLRGRQCSIFKAAEDRTENSVESIAAPVNAPQDKAEKAGTSIDTEVNSSDDLCPQQSPIERFKAILVANGSGAATVQDAVLALELAEKLAEKRQLLSTAMTTAKDYTEAMNTFSELLLCPEYNARNRAYNGLLTKTITQFVNMLRVEQQLRNEKLLKTHMLQEIEPITQLENAETTICTPLPCQNELPSRNDIIGILLDNNLEFADKRPQGGCLWVVGSIELNDFFGALKEKGFSFHFAKNGSNSTGFAPGWYLDAQSVDAVSHSGNEVDILLDDDDYEPLRLELARQQIMTIDALRELKLWPFMNQYNLYSIGVRYRIYTQVRDLLYPTSSTDKNELYVIHCGSAVFRGRTPAEAFFRFCEDAAIHFPLKIRNIVDVRFQHNQPTALTSKPLSNSFFKMENPIAYIDAALSVDSVIGYIRYLTIRLGYESNTVTMDQPVPRATEVRQIEIPAPEPFHLETVPVEPQRTAQVTLNLDNTMISEAESIVQKADMEGITMEELQSALNITMVATRQFVADNKSIVNINGRLYHEGALIDWKDAAMHMAAILEKLMKKNNGYVSSAQLYEYTRAEMNMFLNDNDMNNERAVYEIAQHLFDKVGYQGKRYRFYGKVHISRLSDAISSNFDIIQKYATEHGGVFALVDLESYLKGINVKTGNLRNQMRIYSDPEFFCYDDGLLIHAQSMHIDEHWMTEVRTSLNKLFMDVGDHIIMRDIRPFWFEQLPLLPGGNVWTPLLLQSVLRFYTKPLGARTISAMDSQAIETLHTMLVREDSPIQNFGDVVATYLVENAIPQRQFEAEELRGMLVDAGILRGNELIWNMPKALSSDERFAWDATGNQLVVKV
jgi:hypothetical protein